MTSSECSSYHIFKGRSEEKKYEEWKVCIWRGSAMSSTTYWVSKVTPIMKHRQFVHFVLKLSKVGLAFNLKHHFPLNLTKMLSCITITKNCIQTVGFVCCCYTESHVGWRWHQPIQLLRHADMLMILDFTFKTPKQPWWHRRAGDHHTTQEVPHKDSYTKEDTHTMACNQQPKHKHAPFFPKDTPQPPRRKEIKRQNV